MKRGPAPGAVVEHDPDAVDGDELADLLPGELAAIRGDLLEVVHHAVDHAVFHLVVAMRRHGRRLPGARQLVLQLGERLAGVAVEHVEHGERRHQAVVIAAAERRVEEEMARLLEADQSAGLVAVALDVGMAGLPELGRGAMRLQHRIGEEEPGRFHVGDEQRAVVAGGDVAGEHHADLVGEDRLALVVDHAAPVAVAVEGEPEIGAMLEHGVACRVQHAEIFGIRIMGGEGVVELAIERDDGGAKLGEDARRESPRRAVAAGDDHLQGAQQFRARQGSAM